jgi:hypothetical protein
MVVMAARRTAILRPTIAAVLLLLVVLSTVFPCVLSLAACESAEKASNYAMARLVAKEGTAETACKCACASVSNRTAKL